MGSFIAGAEGKNSKIKRQLIGEEKSRLYTFPMGFVGLKMRLAPEKIAPFRNLSPVFFHGAHPNGKFIFFSTISTPEVNGSKGTENEHFEAQLNMSWIIGDDDAELPSLGPVEKLQAIKNAANEGTGFFKQLREGFKNIPDDTEVLDVTLQDYVPEPWPSSSRATLLGDAVHPMTMCKFSPFVWKTHMLTGPDRGEAANHGMFDAYKLRGQLRQVQTGKKTVAQALADYEKEMVLRAQEAVKLSREAGFEVHDIEKINEASALFRYPQVLSGNPYD